MLEFKEVFSQGHMLESTDVSLILQCKNIDFGYVGWRIDGMYNNENLMYHIIDNVIDVDIHENNDTTYLTLFCKILHFCKNPIITHYMLNNGYISNETYNKKRMVKHYCYNQCCTRKYYNKQLDYLTSISLNKFKGYYNLEKYYNILHVMLLVMKSQKKLPSSVIKHLIIPFIYQ